MNNSSHSSTGLADIRQDYKKGELLRRDLHDEPFSQFDLWMRQAIEAKVVEPTAMTLATVNENLVPSQRTVLLKGFNPKGLVFFTNLGSTKAQQIKTNACVSAHFPWLALERQVAISGKAEPLSRKEVLKYFISRPKESRIGAWASKQSQVISNRSLLMQQFEKMKQKFHQGEVPLPDFWGGYRIIPERFEFWQGGQHRLHDRFEYLLQADDSWVIQRLSP